MADVSETPLPGVGVRFDFVTGEGRRIGVLAHRSGRRDLLVYDAKDPDACRAAVNLDDDEARTLAELLGGSQIARQLADMQQRIEGLAIDWLSVAADSTAAGRTLRDAALRTQTGASIIAVIRGDTAIPAPGPDVTLEPGDIAVAIGTPDGLRQLFDLLRRG